MPNRGQTITGPNDDPLHLRIYPSLGLNVLTLEVPRDFARSHRSFRMALSGQIIDVKWPIARQISRKTYISLWSSPCFWWPSSTVRLNKVRFHLYIRNRLLDCLICLWWVLYAASLNFLPWHYIVCYTKKHLNSISQCNAQLDRLRLFV